MLITFAIVGCLYNFIATILHFLSVKSLYTLICNRKFSESGEKRGRTEKIV